MDIPIQDGLDAVVRAPEFVRRYPHFVWLLGRLQVVSNPEVAVMAVSSWGSSFLLHVNPVFFDEKPQYVAGVLVHELHHLVLGHLTHPKFRNRRHPALMNLAMEISANENVAEPLPGDPATLESLRSYGIRRGQSTLERYRLLVEAARHHRLPVELLSGLHHAPIIGPGGEPLSQPSVPGSEAGELIERLTAQGSPDPRVDWRAALREFASRLRTPQPSWLRPARRFPQAVGIVPGRSRAVDPTRKPKLLVAIDTSSSVSTPEMQCVAGELQHIARLAELTVAHCDVRIHRVHRFEGELPEIQGRGGTNLCPPFESEFLAQHRPDGIVYFTDGEGPFPPEDPGVPTLWVLTRPVSFACPWGRRVNLPPPGIAAVAPVSPPKVVRSRRPVADARQVDLPF
jgi:predicted metal-dependent peptidase